MVSWDTITGLCQSDKLRALNIKVFTGSALTTDPALPSGTITDNFLIIQNFLVTLKETVYVMKIFI